MEAFVIAWSNRSSHDYFQNHCSITDNSRPKKMDVLLSDSCLSLLLSPMLVFASGPTLTPPSLPSFCPNLDFLAAVSDKYGSVWIVNLNFWRQNVRRLMVNITEVTVKGFCKVWCYHTSESILFFRHLFLGYPLGFSDHLRCEVDTQLS